jgi:hypothetical protein
MKSKALILGLVILTLLLDGCIEEPTRSEEARPEEAKLGEVKIQADQSTYSPIMSSAPGIGLTPLWTLGRPMQDFDFHWHTNYGYFLSWGPPSSEVKVLGPEVIILGSEVIDKGVKVYWSYDPEEIGAKKPPVQISLIVKDTQSAKILTMSDLEIEWESRDVAKVKIS